MAAAPPTAAPTTAKRRTKFAAAGARKGGMIGRPAGRAPGFEGGRRSEKDGALFPRALFSSDS